MRLIVKDEMCIGCEQCESEIPELFRMKKNGETAELIVDPVPEELVERAREMAATCPAYAVEVEEDDDSAGSD
jgi:ferredoxin